MGGRVGFCFISLHLLLVMFAQAREGRQRMKETWEQAEVDERSKQIELNDHMETASAENPVIRMVTKMADNSQEINSMTHQHHAHSSSHMEHMNPLFMVFFTINDLKLGKKLPVYFPKRDPSTSPPLLPREKADPIPFSLKQLPEILSYFSFSSGSPQAKAVEETLHQCELRPIKGETKFCATSLESMVGFVRTAFGSKSPIKLLTTAHLTKSDVHLQNYTFFDTPKEIPAPKLVACHTMPYPYAVYYCHYQEGDNRVLQVPLEGENGDRVDSVAVCHMDTSQWSPTHASFQVLGIEPGTIPVCHFFPADDFVWIPMSA